MNGELSKEHSNCSLLAYSEVQPIWVLISALNALLVGD